MLATRSLFRSAASQLVRYQSTVAANRQITEDHVPRIVTMQGRKDGKLLEVQWEDGTVGEFPYVWLRDCAPMRRSTASLNDVQLDVEPEKLALSDKGDAVLVQWPPYYNSQYSSKWLREHVFDDCGNDRASSIELWSKDFHDKLPRFALEDLMARKNARKQMLASLERYGVVKVEGCYSTRDHDALMRQIPMITAKVGTTEKSLSTAHVVHTAGSHMLSIPVLTTLRFLSQADAHYPTRLSMSIVDGFTAATDLRAAHLSMFEFLCAQKVEYVSEEGRSKAAHPMISTDAVRGVADMWGCITQVVFNNARRSSHITMPPTKLGQFYSALKQFQLSCFQNAITVNVNQGDVFLLNNHRVLHGTPAIENATIQQTFYN
uniref:TauD/TfdA-like domain-containing protein n=1 Tax=Plectus sambesii TaxID=2011161 RepID=A0A914WBG6_9BILA